MFHLRQKNHKITREEFRSRSKKRFNFLRLTSDHENKKKEFAIHEALSFKKPPKK